MIVRICFLALIAVSTAPAEVALEVVRKMPLWPDAKGTLVISEEAIEFRKEDPHERRRWQYRDIQYFDRVSRKEVVLVTYENISWQFGRDRQFRFVLTSGELTDDLFEQISRRIGRPVTDRVADGAPKEAARLAVKHLHTFGGCEGELVFGDTVIFYVTDHAKDARKWKIDRDMDSIWALNRYQLEIHVYDNNRREFSKTRVYRFQLKEPLDPVLYRDLKLRLYGLRSERRVIP